MAAHHGGIFQGRARRGLIGGVAHQPSNLQFSRDCFGEHGVTIARLFWPVLASRLSQNL
jgi:hypothetical protein